MKQGWTTYDRQVKTGFQKYFLRQKIVQNKDTKKMLNVNLKVKYKLIEKKLL